MKTKEEVPSKIILIQQLQYLFGEEVDSKKDIKKDIENGKL
tara:strand:- start:3765 stop:3887 length:123 start_codon:yes stop_codon:yes gene_type:complete